MSHFDQLVRRCFLLAARPRWPWMRLLAALCFLIVLALFVKGAIAHLDPTFGGGDGLVTTDFGGSRESIAALVIQADGRIITAGTSERVGGPSQFALARYNAGGSLDPSFGHGGTVTAGFGEGPVRANALAVQPDGKILVVGSVDAYGSNSFALARYNVDGGLDSDLDGDGRVIFDFDDGQGFVSAVVVQMDGKIVVAGSTNTGASQYRFALARYNSDGSLDPSFGTGGFVFTDVGEGDDYAYALAIQPDGKLVAAGGGYGIKVARYNPDGSLDLSFDGDGKVITNLATTGDRASDLVLQPDGKIVVAGWAWIGGSEDFVLVRYNANGSVDTGFGGDGNVTTDFGSRDQLFSIVLQPDGKLVAAGAADAGGVLLDFALARYNPDGGLDSGFGGDGKITTDFGLTQDWAYALALQPDGKLVAGGTNGADFALARYNADGSLDSGFDDRSGVVTTDFAGDNDRVFDLAIQADGKLVAGGTANMGWDRGGFNFALARYNPDGSLDTNFGIDGKATTDFFYAEDQANALALQPDAKIVLVGHTQRSSYDFALARYTADGIRDSSFGNRGKVATDFGGADDWASAVALQADGKIVVAGATDNGLVDIALARYTPDGNLDPTFGNNGLVTTNLSWEDRAFAVAVQPDGKIVVAGSKSEGLVLVRYDSNGTVDSSFGSGGIVTSNLAGEAHALVITPEEELLVGGSTFSGTSVDFALVRYHPDGSLDTAFGQGGKVTTDIAGGSIDVVYDLTLLPDGGVVAAGSTDLNYPHDFALVRYDALGGIELGFGSGGRITTQTDGYEPTTAVVLQADGKIVVAGSTYKTSNHDFILARYDNTLATNLVFLPIVRREVSVGQTNVTPSFHTSSGGIESTKRTAR